MTRRIKGLICRLRRTHGAVVSGVVLVIFEDGDTVAWSWSEWTARATRRKP